MFSRVLTVLTAFLSCMALPAYAVDLNDSIPNDTVLLYDGSLYMGQIRDSLFNGKGTCIYADGTVYQGEWKDGLWDGQGTVTYPDGDIYKGTFRQHIKEGKGSYFYNTGARYSGEWMNDRFNGKGKLYFADGGMYDGAWKDDMKHGYGLLISYDGHITNGYFYNDDYLGMPYDTEIEHDSIMTDELREWGFKQEKYHLHPTVSIGLSYGFKSMATVSLWVDYAEHFYYGFSIGLDIDPPTRGVPTGMGQYLLENDIHMKGEYISSQYLADAGLVFGNLAFGGAIGLGLRSLYWNCRANNSDTDQYKAYWTIRYGDPYSRRSIEGHKLMYRGIIRYKIPAKKTKAQVYLGYGRSDGPFIGVGADF